MSLPSFGEILDTAPETRSGRLATRKGDGWTVGEAALPVARRLAAALLGYGLAEAAPVAVLGGEGRALLTAHLAVLAAGATLVPLDPDADDDGLRAAMRRTGAVQAIAADEAHLARILAWRPDLPDLDLVLLMEARPSERRPAALLAEEALRAGDDHLAAEPGMLRAAMARGGERGVAVVFPDPGGDKPISRSDLSALAGRIAGTLGVVTGSTLLTCLPVTALARLSAALAALAQGATLALAPSGGPLDTGLSTLAPSAALSESSAIVRLRTSWSETIDRKGFASRAVTRWALRRGADAGRHPWLHRLADGVVLAKLRGRLGGRLRVIHAVGAPLHPEIAAFFTAIGVPTRAFGIRMAR